VPPTLLPAVLPALPAAGFRGVNVTLPHKQSALALATDPSPRAQRIGAANTLVFAPDGTIAADNTDAPALIDALPRPVGGLRALVLGAGGSARAAVWALIDAGAAEVRVWNRTPERAEALCADLGGHPVTAAEPADLLVNCTTIGLDGAPTLEGLPLTPAGLGAYGCVADLVYVSGETALVAAARSAGVAVIGGLELLVGQGALSFELFTGQPAPRAAMRAAVGLGAQPERSSGG
jgi:shikimate dehydrogenase